MTSPGGHLKVVKGVIPGQSHPATASSIPSSREPPIHIIAASFSKPIVFTNKLFTSLPLADSDSALPCP